MNILKATIVMQDLSRNNIPVQDIKYNTIGTGYNSTRRADEYLTNRLFHLLKPVKDKLYLDIGCGTGNYTIALADKGVSFVGIEPSDKMLKEAKLRSKKVNWLTGTAEQIPTEDKIFDGAIATLTIHHWTNLEKAFIEINRVLSDSGRFVLFTSTREQMKGYWLNHYFPQMMNASILQMPSMDNIIEATTNAGFELTTTEKYFIRDDQQDHFLYVGKNRPELYFNEQVRNGISSFSSLSNIAEVEQGLQKLNTDLNSNAFEAIKKNYNNDIGDYIFITLQKRDNT